MEEMNTGMPPAGEAGMCATTAVSGSFQYWNGEHFCYYAHTPDEAYALRTGKSDRQKVAWRFYTLAELTAAGISEDEARKMVHRSQVVDAQDEGWGPWIDWAGGECPIPNALAGDFEIKVGPSSYCNFGSQMVGCYRATDFDLNWRHSNGCRPIIAYRLKLEDKPATATQQVGADPWHDWHEGDTVPAVDRVDIIRTDIGIRGATEKQIDNVVVTSQHWGPGSFVRKWRPAVVKPVADPNTKMISRDADGDPPGVIFSDKVDMLSFDHAAIIAAGHAYARRAHNERVSAAAWVERPRDHRLGSFN